jgi:hypothetical protein
MNSDSWTKWTAIVTNLAVVVGLVFVGLEFRSNTRAVEAESVNITIQGSVDLEALLIENPDFASLLYESHVNPSSLAGHDLDLVQSYLALQADNFRRILLSHEAGLVSDYLYEHRKAAIGFSFASDTGREVLDIFGASAMNDKTWEVIRASAVEARSYCLNPKNKCTARYEALRGNNR